MNPRKKITYVLSNRKIFVGLEDSKKTWKICVRSDRRIVHETTLPADYDNLHNYFTNTIGDGGKRLIFTGKSR